MNNDVIKTIRAFGKPITLLNEQTSCAGYAIFRECYPGEVEEEAPRVTERGIEIGYPFSIWAAVDHKISDVKRIVCADTRYNVLSGIFDDRLGCFRLMIREEKDETA